MLGEPAYHRLRADGAEVDDDGDEVALSPAENLDAQQESMRNVLEAAELLFDLLDDGAMSGAGARAGEMLAFETEPGVLWYIGVSF